MTPAQCKAGRLLLGWSQSRLGGHCNISSAAIRIFESTGRMPTGYDGTTQDGRVAAVRTALEAAGIEFVQEGGDSAGVRLHKPSANV